MSPRTKGQIRVCINDDFAIRCDCDVSSSTSSATAFVEVFYISQSVKDSIYTLFHLAFYMCSFEINYIAKYSFSTILYGASEQGGGNLKQNI